MQRRWTDDHGDNPLGTKFHVYKPRDAMHIPHGDGDVAYYKDARIGADGEFVFVLRPETDAVAVYALDAYADGVHPRDPELAADIKQQLARIREANHVAA